MDKIISGILRSGTVKDNSHIIVGFSGGPDSLCLLHALWTMSSEHGLTIIPVHINHMFRGATADAERDRAIEMCSGMGLECRAFDIDCAKYARSMGVSDEEAGRQVRYGIFSRVAESVEEAGTDHEDIAIAVAQNADDQSETVMFRAIRGTGIRGLAGIRRERRDEKGYRVIRPVLGIERADIEEYIERNGLRPNMDESNKKTDYSRNMIRLELLPYIEKNINTNVKQNLRRLAEIAASEDGYMQKQAEEAFSECVCRSEGSLIIDTGRLGKYHPAIVNRVAALALDRIGGEDLMRYDLITGIASLIFSGRPSARIDLPKPYSAYRDYGDLIIGVDAHENACTEAMPELTVSVIGIQEFRNRHAEAFAAFDYRSFIEKHPDGKVDIRFRRQGDIIGIGSGKSKKIQDLMVDDKISRGARDTIPVVASGDEILWIPPHPELSGEQQRNKGKYSQNYQITDKSESVLFLEIGKKL